MAGQSSCTNPSQGTVAVTTGYPADHVMAYQMLKLPHITSFINLKLAEYGFGDDHVEKEHLFLINQHADLKSKKAAIDMFYKLKGKYPSEKLDLTSGGQKILGIQMVVPEGATVPQHGANTDTPATA